MGAAIKEDVDLQTRIQLHKERATKNPKEYLELYGHVVPTTREEEKGYGGDDL